MKKIFLLLSMGLLLFSCGPQENPDPDTVIINQNGFTLEIPAGAFENDGEIFIGKTGDEPTSVPNPDLTVVGEPFTLKLPVDTLLAPITLSFPLPEESLTVNNGLFLLYNGTSYFPFEYEIIDGKVVVTIDTIDWEDISTKGKIAELLGFSLFSDEIDDEVHIDERYLGIKEVSVVSDKVNYDDPTSINSSSNILIFVHGLTGDPTGWEEYIKKIYQEPGRLSYTNIWTFGYHSDQDIDVRGGEFKRLLEQKINGRNPTIHIVAHSMGGLVSRSMLETHKGDNVGLADKLITLGTPHHGSPIEPIRHLIGLGVLLQGDIVNIIPYYKKMTQGAKDLNPESDFITRMRRSVSRNCSYYTIACKNKGFWAVLLRIPFFLSPNDGLVSVNSAKGVQGAESPSFDVTVPVPMAHFNMRTFSHEDPDVNVANEELYAQVKEFLQKNEQVATPPSVTTGDITNITTTTASCSGNVTSDGGAAIIASGVCWSTSENPTVANSKTTDGADLGPYTSHITGLSPNTTYYVRAYATNAEGTAYGEEQRTFKTLPVSDIEYGSLTDPRDGNVYKTVTIGGKEWMAENLKYLPEVVGPATNSPTTSYYYVYGFDGTDVNAAKATENYQTYGVLYNWPAAMNGAATSNTIPSGVQGACPEGWHLPSDAEWKQLEMYLGVSQSEADKTGWRGTDEGGKMKHPGTEYWGEPNTGATNSSGFTALPGGLLMNNGIFGYMHVGGHWWSSTQYVEEVAWWRIFLYYESKVNRGQQPKSLGLSVRCIKDYQKEPGSSPDYGTFTDQRDQTVYKTITIGDKEWMAENLKYLPEVVGPATNSPTTSYYYVYGYDGTDVNAAKSTANYQTYGVLYNWPAAMNGAATSNTIPSGVQGVCPTGWHLPSDAEWKQLEMYLGMSQSEADKTGWRGTDEGGKMKHPGTEYWDEPNTGATNSSGFTALPGGLLMNNGIFGYMHVGGHWWSSTQYVEEVAWWRIFLYYESKVNRGQQPKSLGLSVRCIKD